MYMRKMLIALAATGFAAALALPSAAGAASPKRDAGVSKGESTEFSSGRRYYRGYRYGYRPYYRPYRYGYYRPYYRPYRYGYYRPYYRPYGYYRPWGYPYGYRGIYAGPGPGFYFGFGF
jgi:hypothetical protein